MGLDLWTKAYVPEENLKVERKVFVYDHEGYLLNARELPKTQEPTSVYYAFLGV